MSDARMGEWYRVSSWMGPKWVRLNETPHIEGHSEQYVRKIKLTDAQTAMYKYPGDESLEPLGTLQPQEAPALERWNDWALIRTWMGDVWIRYKE